MPASRRPSSASSPKRSRPADAPASPAHHAGAPAGDERWHELGRVAGAWGVKGWIKVQPHAADPQALLAARSWRLVDRRLEPLAPPSLPEVERAVRQARRHGEFVIAQLDGIDDRTAAEGLRGRAIDVPRAAFPRTLDDEYYWVDLIGLEVVNREGAALGRVVGLVDTGPQAVLRVAADTADAEERLIPFVSAYVDEVDLAARRVRVDWGLDY